MGDLDIALDDADWSEDLNMGECDPGAPLTGILTIHMRTLHISSSADPPE